MIDTQQLAPLLERQSAPQIIAWAAAHFGDEVVVSSSFQTQSLPLLHIVSQVAPELPVLFVDTGQHFADTLAYRDQLAALLGLNVRVVRAALSRQEVNARYGDDLYRRDPDLCCYLNKIEPMERALHGARAWISGVRRDQTTNRRSFQVVEEGERGIIRVHPLLNWTRHDVETYIARYELPHHPLHELGYTSVSCWPCTAPIHNGDDERAGRWQGTDKTECGLHTRLRKQME
jgi:phosphoadenosine phosphosulfate reductase